MSRNGKEADRVKEQAVTYETYAELPDDGRRYEVIDGSLELMSPGPSPTHQSVSGELQFLLRTSCNSDYKIFGAPLDVILSDTDVLQPDILMVHRSRLQIVTNRGVEGPPDLIAEIVSPSSRKRDKVVKMRTYARYGVPEYWIVDPETRTLEQYRREDGGFYELCDLFEGDDAVVPDRFPCVSFAIRDIFRDMSGV